MFTDLQLDSFYTSEDDIAETFLGPVLHEATTYDRVSAYFSAEALAAYSEGLEFFARQGHSYRLIVSKDVSEKDFEMMQVGYAMRRSLADEMLKDLRRSLTLEQEKGLSNLAHLIAVGVLDIKIAFKRQGVFHDKFGILKDADGNRLKFTGSNNETAAALYQNHESFSVTCDWMDRHGFYARGIDKSQRLFEAYWQGGFGEVLVRNIEDTLLKELLRHDKGEIVSEAVLLKENTCVLDIRDDGRLYLSMNLPDYGEYLAGRGFIRSRLKKYMEKDAMGQRGIILFREGLTYIEFKQIDDLLGRKIPEEGYAYEMTVRLRDVIHAQEIHIAERATLGIDIKRRDKRLEERFHEFEDVVNFKLERKLRSRQMWDAFFMTMMIKSGNYSVPGSGKTSSVLGMFAFLQETKGMRRIVMIGPKNSFGSWIDEFRACFGQRQELRLFNLHSDEWHDNDQKHRLVRHHYDEYNLLLFNYESLQNWEEDIRMVVSQQDTMLVFDEVHKIKNISGKRDASALYIAQAARYVTVMTGTPIPNGYEDIYNMLNLMFPNEYHAFFGYRVSELKDPSDSEQEEINQKLKPFYCRTTKTQLRVPEALPDLFNHVEASKSENRLFYLIKQAYHRNNRLLWFIRTLQLESDPKMLLEAIDINDFNDLMDTDATEIEDIDFKDCSQEIVQLVSSVPAISTKMKKCIELLTALVGEGKQVICWCIFRRSIRNVKRELKRIGIQAEIIDGSVDQADRLDIINRFRNKEFDVLITNPHTLAESVSLHSVCHDAVYFEYSYNLVHLLQSKDRIHRLGLQEGQYTQYHYLMEDFLLGGIHVSLDESVYQRLCEKEQLMLKAIDDERLERTTTRDEDLDMLFEEVFGKGSD